MFEQAQRQNQFMAPDTCSDWMLCLNYLLQIRSSESLDALLKLFTADQSES